MLMRIRVFDHIGDGKGNEMLIERSEIIDVPEEAIIEIKKELEKLKNG